MKTLKEMRERMTVVAKELRDLHGKIKDGTITDEEEQRLQAVLDEFNDLGPKIQLAQATEEAEAQARRFTAEPNGRRVSGEPPLDGAEDHQGEKRDFRPPVARYLESEQFQRYQRHPKGVGERFEVGSFWRRNQQRADLSGLGPEEVRALIYSGTGSASFLLPDVFPEIYRGLEPDLNMRDVLLNAQTTSDAVTILRENVFTNAAAPVAEATLVSEGAKPESSITLTEATFPVRTLAHWIPITRQMLDDLAMMRTYVETRLEDGLRRVENNQILNGSGVAPNLTGLYNTTGIQDLDTAVYFTANPVANATTGLENFDRILRAKRVVRDTGDARATFVVLNPADYEVLQTAADANDRYLGTGPFTTGAIPTLWGLTVVEDENNAAGTALVGDGSMAAVVDRMDATIFTTDSHADFFIRNIIVILAEERIALPVFRPAAFAAVELA